jgi:hypothetical protein
MHICAGIEYGDVHSDLCFDSDKLDDEYRKTLHAALDEALNHLDIDTFFFIGTP